MKIKEHNVEETAKTNAEMIEQIYKMTCKVFDVASYLSNRAGGNGCIPRFQSESGIANSDLIREATEGIVVAILREKYEI